MTAGPRATYRLQFRDGMTFERAAALVPYLAALGVSHLYASPVFAAAGGSSHGYDVADHGRLDPQLGGDAGFATLAAALDLHGVGLILDIVPNHMAATVENPWWADVLTWGRASAFAGHFDIDWTSDRLLIPTLGEPYGDALAAGKLALRLDAATGWLGMGYAGLTFPLTPPSCPLLASAATDDALATLFESFRDVTPQLVAPHLAAFRDAIADPPLHAALEATLAAATADPAVLHALHEAQPWRLAYWRLARESLTYRRFFEIADLVGVRVEQPQVFADVHGLALRLVAEGRVDGLRIDHVDGLAQPKQYLDALRAAGGPDCVLVEKILGPDEELPADWATQGTTGYEMARLITGLQVDPAGEPAMTKAWTAFAGADPDYPGQVLEAKRRTLRYNLASELDRLTATASRIAATDLATRDFGPDALMRAIVEIAVALPVYRTYIDADGASAEDRRLIEQAVAAAKASRQTEDDRVPAFIGRLLLSDERTPDVIAFIGHFQQATGPLTAKAVEDTLFYRYNRLIALNEVGAEPDRFGLGQDDFHAAMRGRAARWPAALSATATHDTKRGEDARARIAVLSEMPREWAEAVRRWQDMAEPRIGPDLQWLFYQSLLGAWPAGHASQDETALSALAERLDAFMIKALREAKLDSSWTEPNRPFEAETSAFVRAVLTDRALVEDIASAFRPILAAGFVNSLAQLALKLTVPGVPDIYQGTELIDLSLVDPDNRRPVDFAARAALLREAEGMDGGATLPRWRDGLPKLWLLARLLRLRAERPGLFAEGGYEGLTATGPAAGHVVAFTRRRQDEAVITVVPRLPLRLLQGRDEPCFRPADFADTFLTLPADLAPERLRDLHGRPCAERTLAVGDLLSPFPVQVLS